MSWWWPRVYKAFKNLTGNYYQETSVPFPIHQPCLREWRWRTTPKPHAKTTFHSPYKLGFFGNWGLQHFSENMFLEKHSVSLFWKPAAQKPSFSTQTLLIKARTRASWEANKKASHGSPHSVLSNSNSVLNATDQLNPVRMSHILICSTVYVHLSYRHAHFGRFMLWLEKIRRHLISYRAKPGNPAFLLDGYQRIMWQRSSPHLDFILLCCRCSQGPSNRHAQRIK